jgi:hypothetical protein
MSANPNGIRMRRAERAEQVKRLKDAGLTFKEIADYLGVARSTVTSAYYDPSGAAERARKERHHGTCQDCGARTTYVTGGSAKRCSDCRHQYEKRPDVRLLHRNGNKRTWSDAQILNAIRNVAVNGTLTVKSYDEARSADPGSMPSVPLIISRFGKWNAAVDRAGCQPAHRPRPYSGALTRDGALLAVEDCAAEFGRPPSLTEYEQWAKQAGAPCATRVRQLLGGWQEVTRILLGREYEVAA